MAFLIRTVEKSDIPKIEELVNAVRPGTAITGIARLGGMTNRCYKAVLEGGEELFVRLPGEGTEDLIDRRDEKKSAELACSLGIDSKLYYFDDEGHKVMQYISDPRETEENTLRKKENILQAADIFRRLHTCGADTGVRFELFEMAALYEKVISEYGIELFDGYAQVREAVRAVKESIDSEGAAPRVPCHNDCLVGNWLLDTGGRLYLIDWEYSGMNEAVWDLSCLSLEAGYDGSNDDDLLTAYYKRTPTDDERKRFYAAKLYADYLWSLWGLTRIPFDGDFMKEYAVERYKRLRKNLEGYRKTYTV